MISLPSIVRRWSAALATTLALLGPIAALSPAPARAAESLSAFYVYLQPAWYTPYNPGYDPLTARTFDPPMVRAFYGADRGYASVDIRSLMSVSYAGNKPRQLAISNYWRSGLDGVPCRPYGTALRIPVAVDTSTTVVDETTWFFPAASACAESFGMGPPFVSIEVRDEIAFGAPLRRTAVDGGQYDASPMTIRRNGVSWMTWHWGYRLGLVASTADWVPENAAQAPALATWPALPRKVDELELATLPPPWVEEDVVEYVNRADFPNQPDGQFFYASRAEDKAVLDAIPSWRRTGNAFKSGGYVSVCRFYGGNSGGPNTHFYSADAGECKALRGVASLTYEGQSFAVNLPLPAKNATEAAPGALRDCPAGSKPLYRVFNNPAAGGRAVANHRYTTERADVAAFVARGWGDEGHVMCVPG